MLNPWDVKRVSDLSENEMLGYARFLEQQDTIAQAQELDRTVDKIIQTWRAGREQSPLGGPGVFRFVRHHRIRHVGELSGDSMVYEIKVRLPPWLDEDMARYLAREQLIEQSDPE